MSIRILPIVLALLSAKALFANVVVADSNPGSKEITVPYGEELEIRGSGLAADCRVVLEGYNTIRFYVDAEVAASLPANGDVTLAAEKGVEGVFCGGAILKKTTMLTGEITVRGKDFELNGTTYMKGGRLRVVDAAWRIATNDRSLNINQEQTENACFEVGENGVLELKNLGGNNVVNIGGGSAFESKLLLNGGKFAHGYDAFNVRSTAGGTGVFEIVNGGVFQTYSGINCAGGTGVFIFGDATWNFLSGDYSQSKYPFSGAGTADVTLNGAFVLNVYARAADYADHPDGRVVWRAGDGARLCLNGRADGSEGGFALHNLASGVTLDVSAMPTRARLVDAQGPVAIVKSAASEVAAAGTSPAAVVDCVVTAAETFGGEVEVAGLDGFSRIDLRDLVFRAPGSSSYMSSTALASVGGKISLEKGTLLLDSNPGDGKLEVAPGAAAVFQDSEAALVLARESGGFGPASQWKTAAGENVQWQDGAIARIFLPESNTTMTHEFFMSGLRIAGEGTRYFEGGTGIFNLGGNGLVFESSRKVGFASGSAIPKLTLCADQTWTNSAPSGRAELYFGINYNYPQYCKACLAAAPGVGAWKIAGDLEVWLMNASTDLEGVDVTVSKPASLRLDRTLDARLNAASLRLEGAEMTFSEYCTMKLDDAGTLVTQPAIDAAHLAPELELVGGARLNVASGVSPFAVPSIASIGKNSVAGSGLAVTQSLTRVRVDTAADALDFELPVSFAAPGARFEVSGVGRLGLMASEDLLATDVAFSDAGTLRLSGEGAFIGDVSGAGGLEIAADGLVDFRGSLVDFRGSEIVIRSGTLMLASAASIPEGVKVVTEGEGAFQLVDPQGFEPASRMEGTGNFTIPDGRLLVTDVPRSGQHIVVGPGETLEIYGSGLDATSSVVLQSGATVRFRRTASISAEVSVPTDETRADDVAFYAERGATGTLEKVYSAASQAYLHTVVKGDGRVVFGGGIDLKGHNRLKLLGGNALVSGGVLRSSQMVYMFAGELAFTNSVVEFAGESSFALASGEQTGDASVVFLAGSSWEMGNNSIPRIGKVDGLESRLVLDGGTWKTATYDPIHLCPDGTGVGILEVKAGRFTTNRRIVAGDGGTSKFIWRGGTLSGEANDYNFKYAWLVEGPLTEWLVDGDCRLELSRCIQPAISNFSHRASVMRATPGSRLTVVSDDSVAGRCNRLVLSGFEGDGLCLNLVPSAVNGAPTVEIAGAEGPVSLAWQTDGEGSVLATGTSPALKASLRVPAGTAFANSAALGWCGGFSSVELVDLVFGEGATYVVESDGSGIGVLALAGRLMLPGEMLWRVDRSKGTLPYGVGMPAIEAAGGIEGDCNWVRKGIGKSYSIGTDGGSLLVDRIPVGLRAVIR